MRRRSGPAGLFSQRDAVAYRRPTIRGARQVRVSLEELDIPAAAAVGELSPGAQSSTGPGPRPDRSARPVLRGLMLLVYLVLAGSFLAETSNTTGLATELITGALLAIVLLVVVAAVALALRRWGYRKNPERRSDGKPMFKQKLVSGPVMLVALALAFVSAAGQQAQMQRHRAQLAVSDAASSNPQNRDRGALAAWMTSFPAAFQDQALALHQLALLSRALSSQTVSSPTVVTYAQAANRYARAFAADVAAEPAPTPDVEAIKGLYQQAANLFLNATGDYLRGLRNRDLKLLREGDALIRRSEQLTRQTGQQGDALYHRFGGYQAFGGRIDFQAYSQALQQAEQATKP